MSDEIKIETGVPIPERGGRTGGLMQAMRTMKVGDSFTVPRLKQSQMSHTASLADIKIATRKVDENTIRVWRIA